MFATPRSRIWARVVCMGLALGLMSGCSEEGSRPTNTIELTLDNGLRVRLMPDPGSGLVASNIFVGAGSTRETETTAGSSHFLEHLLFNGTHSRTQEQLYDDVERIGAYNNATTRREYTHFMMVAPSEVLDAALGIQADMLLQSVLPEDKFEKERGIVLEELSKDRDDPGYRLERVLVEGLHGSDHPFARPVLGTVETISSLQRDQVLRYYRRQYVPSNMLVVLMGEFDPDRAVNLLQESFGAAEAGEEQPSPPLSALQGCQLVRRPIDDDNQTLQIDLPAPPPSSEDHAAFSLLARVLGGDGGRIARALAQEPVLAASSLDVGLAHFELSSRLQVRVRFGSELEADEVLRRILGSIATVAEQRVGAQEWSRARTAALSEAVRQREQLHYYALLQGDRIWHAPENFEEHFEDELERSYGRMDEVAKRWLQDPALRVVMVGPGLPSDESDLDLHSAGYVAASGDYVAAPLPGGGQVAGDLPTVQERVAPFVSELPNGMTLIQSATPTTRMFALHLLVRDRSAREPEGLDGIADLLHRCLPQGAGNYDREELATLLDGIGAEIKVTDSPWIPYDDYYSTPLFSWVRLDCVDLYWREAIRLMGLMIGDPRLESEPLERARGDMLQRLQMDAQKPPSVAARRLRELLHPGHPLSRSIYGSEESLMRVDERTLRGFHLEYFDPGNLVLAVVGNLDPQIVREEIQARFDVGAAAPGARVERVSLPLTVESRREELAVGGQQAQIRMGRVMELKPQDRWALRVAVMIASDRMQQDLRETRGLAYSLGVSCEFLDDRVVVVARMGTRPDNLEVAEAEMRRILTQSSLETTVDEIATVVNESLGRQRMRRVTRIGQAYNLCRDLEYGGGLDAARLESEGLRSVGPDDVRRAGERYLTEGPFVTVVAR